MKLRIEATARPHQMSGPCMLSQATAVLRQQNLLSQAAAVMRQQMTSLKKGATR